MLLYLYNFLHAIRHTLFIGAEPGEENGAKTLSSLLYALRSGRLNNSIKKYEKKRPPDFFAWAHLVYTERGGDKQVKAGKGRHTDAGDR